MKSENDKPAPEACPRCESAAVVPIRYGMPGPELAAAAERGEVELGGCLVPVPWKWSCLECGYRWPLPPEALESDLVRSAFAFACDVHGGHVRKAGGGEYAAHPVEVAHMLYEQGFGEAFVAAGLLHDVVEDTCWTVEDMEERFGGEVSVLVDVLTEDKRVEEYMRRKAIHRAKVEETGMPAAAIYAADKLANLRALRAAYREQGEAVGRHFNAPLEDKIENWQGDVEMLTELDPEMPFLADLEIELLRFRADRVEGRAS